MLICQVQLSMDVSMEAQTAAYANYIFLIIMHEPLPVYTSWDTQSYIYFSSKKSNILINLETWPDTV